IITGASGFIGKALTKKLLQEGKTVYAVVRDEKKITDLSKLGELVPIEIDLENISGLHGELQGEKIDVFYHLANHARYPEDNQNYVAQLLNTKYCCDALTEAVNINCNKFILVGTSYQYQKNSNGNDKEHRKCSIYGAARHSAQLLCETIAQNNGMHFNTILLTNCYGVGDYSLRSTNRIISTFLSGESPNLIEGNNKHDWVYIDDLINGLVTVAAQGKNFQDYYVGHRQLKTFKKIIEDVRDVINPSIELNFGTYNDSSYIDYSLIDLDALYNDTGFECKSNFQDSILKTAEWVKALNL
ncbi:MAG: NAD(P)-dependent oxidoreductase, partial [Firmicutes bacterium]|nr:NAD(P)-dependent oxidoreductase [Bacillota bacterium]